MATQTQALDAPVVARRSSGLWRDAFGRLIKNRLAIVGLILVILFAFIALFGPWLAPYPYQQQDVAATAPYRGPIPPMTDGHVLGTDQLGRDLLSRIMDGAQISFTVAIVVQIVVLLIGIPIGALAGWFGGRMDNYLMRFTDVIYAFPDLLFIIILTVASGRPGSAERWTGSCSCSSPSGSRHGSPWRAWCAASCCH
jgi:ABC-type dipeptide/oligopeptide/nickel transport system permease subunit